MSEHTNIEWCDSTFNPWIGCTKVSPACDHCYAERSTPARTMKVIWGAKAERHRTSAATWALPKRWNAQADAFHAEHGRRQRVFCASLADVFDNAVDPEWRQDLANLILDTPNLDWLLLTKRIGNAGAMLGEMFLDGTPDNIWLGATVVNQEEADRDIPKLVNTQVRVRFLSIEPMLGPIDLWDHTWQLGAGGIQWVIVGGESGHGARPMHPNWAGALRDQCAAAGTDFLFKQWGEWAPHRAVPGGDERGDLRRGHVVYLQGTPREPDGRFLRGDAAMARVGKKAAGRLLDGRTHDEVPS